MDKEYLVFDTARDSELEDTLNTWAEKGYEFCGIVNKPNVPGGKIGTSVIMRKMPEMDNSDVSEDLYSEPWSEDPKPGQNLDNWKRDERTTKFLEERGW